MLICAVLLTTSGELSLKHGMNQVGVLSFKPNEFIGSIIRTFTNPFVLVGFALVFLASILWLGVISRVELSFAYPMLSLGYVVTVFGSWILFGENVTLTRLAGVFIVITGVYVISRS